jgi:hypothetical protein
MAKTPTCKATGRQGGKARLTRLTEERRREIASAASREAVLARRGLPTRRKIAAAYLAELTRRDPDLARLIELGMKCPDRYAQDLETLLSPADWANVMQSYSAACNSLAAEAQP